MPVALEQLQMPLIGQRRVALPFQHLQQQRQLGHLDRLGVDVHAEKVRGQDALLLLDRQPPLAVLRVLIDGLAVLFRLVLDVPLQAVVQAGTDTPPAGTSRCRRPCRARGTAAAFAAGQFGRALALDLLADRLLDDVIDDVRRRVVDAARLADLGLFLDLRLVPRAL